MENALRDYIEEQFAGAQSSRANAELKEELYQNLMERYRDLINEGKDPQSAYNIAVASIGDIAPLISGPDPDNLAAMRTSRQRSAIMTAIAVMLYILCPLPIILLSAYGNPVGGIVMMFIFIALATGLIIFNNMTKQDARDFNDHTTVGQFRSWQQQTSDEKRAQKAVGQALWSLTVLIYLIVSFMTAAWHITWIIFLIAAAIEGVIKAAFELRK